jgi:hypothetical protein
MDKELIKDSLKKIFTNSITKSLNKVQTYA